MKKPFYLTTTLPYVNAAPHVGFALEIVQADTIARYKRLMGYDVFFNFGSDEHGQKIWQMAQERDMDTQAYTDEYAAKFTALREQLNLTYDAFIRTTDSKHKAAAQEMWRRCKERGDIYKKNYQVKYCVGCELEKTDSELVNGHCLLHPNIEIELRDEENYFFKLSNYQEQLQKLYERTDFVVPDYRLNEMRELAKKGFEDFSISRLKSKMPWGVEVRDDADHVMYVWFDALVSYISTLNWPQETETFERFWNGSTDTVQMAGKDQVRQQAAMWQAMLMSAKLPLTGQIHIHGFITSGGEKMSKSLGNVIEPLSLVKEYGTDALRYFLLRHIHPTEDSDFTIERFKEAYNADLANGLGNLVARVMQLAQTHLSQGFHPGPEVFSAEYIEALNEYRYNDAIQYIWSEIQRLDQYITEAAPFKVVKTDPELGKKMIYDLTQSVYSIARMLAPMMPATSDLIKEAIVTNTKPTNMFARKE
jgi:methionyl-tRNA synthetase